MAAEQELEATSDVPPESLPTAEFEPGPDEAQFSAVTVMSAAAAAEISLEDAWAWATPADREVFVQQHRVELQKILKKLDRQKAAAPQRRT